MTELIRTCERCHEVTNIDTSLEGQAGAASEPCSNCGSTETKHEVVRVSTVADVSYRSWVSMIMADETLKVRLDTRLKTLQLALLRLDQNCPTHGDHTILRYFDFQSFFIQAQNMAYALEGRPFRGSNLTTPRVKQEILRPRDMLALAWDLGNLFKHGPGLNNLLTANEPRVVRVANEAGEDGLGVFVCVVRHGDTDYNALELALRVYNCWSETLWSLGFLPWDGE